MSFYLWAMRSAAAILFVIAVVIIVCTAIGSVMIFNEAQPFSLQTNFHLVQALLSFVLSLQNATLPLFGAAALWRADRWLANKGAAA